MVVAITDGWPRDFPCQRPCSALCCRRPMGSLRILFTGDTSISCYFLLFLCYHVDTDVKFRIVIPFSLKYSPVFPLTGFPGIQGGVFSSNQIPFLEGYIHKVRSHDILLQKPKRNSKLARYGSQIIRRSLADRNPVQLLSTKWTTAD